METVYCNCQWWVLADCRWWQPLTTFALCPLVTIRSTNNCRASGELKLRFNYRSTTEELGKKSVKSQA